MDASLRGFTEPSCLCPARPLDRRLLYPPFPEVMKSCTTEFIIKYGSGINDNDWWNAKKTVNQTESHRLLQQAFPGHIAMFVLDYSDGHACEAPRSRINLRPGGK